jgi:hypothetical protein
MYKLETTLSGARISIDDQIVLKAHIPYFDINELKRSFYFVPKDDYFTKGSRYRTTSRIRITANGYELMPRAPLYQPTYVNKLDSYGGIDREYADVPESLLKTRAFDIMIKEWVASIPYSIKTFSIHQIRTTDSGNPTPEGPHRDGTDWTGILIVNRCNIDTDSGATRYWGNDGKILIDHVFQEGSLITHFDKYFTHCATPIAQINPNEPSYRDVFVLTSPEHGINHEQEDYRKEVLVADV